MDDADYWLPELSEEAQARVKAMEETYNSTERGDIRSVFTVAIGIDELRTAYYGEQFVGKRDRETAFLSALVRYHITGKNGKVLSKTARSFLKFALDNREKAEAWWRYLNEEERYGWVQPVTIARKFYEVCNPKVEETTGPGGVTEPEPQPAQDDPASWVGAQACVDQLVDFSRTLRDDDQRAIIGERLSAAGYYFPRGSSSTCR